MPVDMQPDMPRWWKLISLECFFFFFVCIQLFNSLAGHIMMWY